MDQKKDEKNLPCGILVEFSLCHNWYIIIYNFLKVTKQSN